MLNVPLQFVAGDRIVWYTDPIPSVNVDTGQAIVMQPPSFTLRFAFRGVGELDVTAIADGIRFKSVVSGADGEALKSGILTWQAYATDSVGDRSTVGTGQTLVIVNLADAATAPLSEVQQLQAQLLRVNAAIDARLSGGVVEYEINGRKLKYFALADLTALRDALRKNLAHAQRAELTAKGRNPRRHYIQFNRP
jgi:hypothetical protein